MPVWRFAHSWPFADRQIWTVDVREWTFESARISSWAASEAGLRVKEVAPENFASHVVRDDRDIAPGVLRPDVRPCHP